MSWQDAVDFADDLLDYRAEVVSESETAMGAAEGERIAFGRMQEDGVISADTVKMWMAQSDACPLCSDLDGETTEVDGFFDTDAGEPGQPPLHNFCRCNVALVSKD